ncbi:Tlg2-vesicle protein [Microsporum canis CBS 113480]|uniref:Tlg2-vesicle protein n=1 Tax=Arthroderma otae (strain ATCC MYA-4605 / CBS 113480) TaxID=554155 RepID=C5FDB9_ARTOC|nr:Tlg2-vesicle protein [Microsporum canis CBS 113480]EEQ27893.1 Tlg2-vesicle protein [Microsporum canis CBS 113480]
MTLSEEFKSRNFSKHLWTMVSRPTGILCMLICFAVGISNLFRVPSVILAFSIVPLLLRICPTSSKFDAFIRRFASNTMRAVIYLAMSTIQWVSLVKEATSLIAAAVFLLFAAIFYALAAVKGQEFTGSKTLGGQGVAQMMV